MTTVSITIPNWAIYIIAILLIIDLVVHISLLIVERQLKSLSEMQKEHGNG